MLPYFIIFLLSIAFFSISQSLLNNKKVGGRLFLLIALLLLVGLAAFRGQTVGTDTYTYLWSWNNLHLASEKSQIWLFSEPFFKYIEKITRYISDETFLGQEVFLGSISLLVCCLTLSSINKLSSNKFLSFFVFLFFGFYTFHFNGARQAIAIALFFYSIKYILNDNMKKYFFVVLVGFLFHKTMLITLPFYFLFRRDFTLKVVLLIVLFTFSAGYSITSFVEYASEYDQRYRNYANSDFEGGGIVSVLFYTVVLLWLYLVGKVNQIDSKLYDISLISIFISVAIGWLSVGLSLNPSGILRLVYYFTQFMIFALPISIFSFHSKLTRNFLLSLFVFFSFFYFYFITSSFSGLAPYTSSLQPFL
jgi:hypothetical protein